jgi:pimeloyl-ACP methyl ester carboxylesterase
MNHSSLTVQSSNLYSHSELASALCSTLPVYLPNRRGRGASSDPSEDFSIQMEINDLKSLLLVTKAQYMLGVSSGAIISLYGALDLSASSGNGGLVKKIVIFEPPIIVDDFAFFEEMRRKFEREIDEEKTAQAFITALTMTGMTG